MEPLHDRSVLWLTRLCAWPAVHSRPTTAARSMPRGTPPASSPIDVIGFVVHLRLASPPARDDVFTSTQAARVSPPLSAALAARRLTPFTNALIEAVTMLPSMPTP